MFGKKPTELTANANSHNELNPQELLKEQLRKQIAEETRRMIEALEREFAAIIGYEGNKPIWQLIREYTISMRETGIAEPLPPVLALYFKEGAFSNTQRLGDRTITYKVDGTRSIGFVATDTGNEVDFEVNSNSQGVKFENVRLEHININRDNRDQKTWQTFEDSPFPGKPDIPLTVTTSGWLTTYSEVVDSNGNLEFGTGDTLMERGKGSAFATYIKIKRTSEGPLIDLTQKSVKNPTEVMLSPQVGFTDKYGKIISPSHINIFDEIRQNFPQNLQQQIETPQITIT